MSLLDLLKQANLANGSALSNNPKTSYTKRVQAKELVTTTDLVAKAATGYAFRSDPALGNDSYTSKIANTAAQGTDPILANNSNYNKALGTTPAGYESKIFGKELRGVNDLVSDTSVHGRGVNDTNRNAYLKNANSSKVTNLSSTYEITPTTAYSTTTFNNKIARKGTKPSNLGANISSYTEQIFNEQLTGANKYTTTSPNVISLASMTKPILTVSTQAGSLAGMPLDDGRYTITVGYGYVLYGVLTGNSYDSGVRGTYNDRPLGIQWNEDTDVWETSPLYYIPA